MIWYPDPTQRNIGRTLSSPALDYQLVRAITRGPDPKPLFSPVIPPLLPAGAIDASPPPASVPLPSRSRPPAPPSPAAVPSASPPPGLPSAAPAVGATPSAPPGSGVSTTDDHQAPDPSVPTPPNTTIIGQ
jgi:hypothetical protein